MIMLKSTFAVAVLALSVLASAPASAELSRNGWTNNGSSVGLSTKADGHALRVIGFELPR